MPMQIVPRNWPDSLATVTVLANQYPLGGPQDHGFVHHSEGRTITIGERWVDVLLKPPVQPGR